MAFLLSRGRCFTSIVGIVPKENGKLEQLMTSELWNLHKSLFPVSLAAQEFHTSCPSNINHRKERAIVRHLNYIDHEKTVKHNYSPLVTLPDYTYLDGRPTEIMLSQERREEKNYHLAKQVVQLANEMKFAQQQLEGQEKAKEDHARHRQQSRLKQKDEELT